MADDPQLNHVLVAILEMLKQQAQYLHRQHGWLIAVADTVRESSPELVKQLEQHPFYDQGSRPDVQTTNVMIQNIDALIRQLRKQ